MATKIASLAVEIGVDASKLEAGLKATQLQLKGVGKDADTPGGKLDKFGKGFTKFAIEGAYHWPRRGGGINSQECDGVGNNVRQNRRIDRYA